MKKIYISLSLLAIVAVSSNMLAQAPTITTAALPQIGFTYNSMSDTASTVTAFTVSAGSGVSQTWNYTAGWDSLYADPTAFVAKGSNPGASSFPSATMAANLGGNWGYFIANSGGLFVDGAHVTIQGTPTDVDYTPNETLIPVPFTLGNSVNNVYTATFNLTISGFPAVVNHGANRTITADAYGTLTTPAGTYPNVLRLKTYEITYDSASVFGTPAFQQYDTTTSYTWIQNTQDAQLMTIDMNHLGVITKASYLQSFNNGIATISQGASAFNLFPNPASDITYLTYENKASGMVNLQLIDITGNQVAVLVNENQAVGQQKLAINLAALHLPKGMYFLQLNSNNNLQTIKLSIN